jgi:predicted MPP superfamily phosphohydrolase
MAAAAGVAAIGIDSVAIEPNRPVVEKRSIELPRWPARLDGFSIALLSDFHYDPYFSKHPLHASISMVNALRPDLIAFTGDFVSSPDFSSNYDIAAEKAARNADPCCALLRQMRAPFGLWAVLGNHDDATDPEYVSRAVQNAGIRLLANASAPIESNGGRFWLSGVDDVLSGTSDLTSTLKSVPTGEATVLLAHEPDYADYVMRYPVDIQLSGHSHGGQVRLPFLPPLYEPALARKYFSGLYKIGPLALYTNRGLGTIGLPVRWNCSPEITLLTLRRGPGITKA